MYDRPALLQALETITAARRDAIAELDTARTARLAATEPPNNQELPQTLGALVRELDNAARELADAIRTVDQRERVLAREPGPPGPEVFV
jgi:hypothetical protein